MSQIINIKLVEGQAKRFHFLVICILLRIILIGVPMKLLVKYQMSFCGIYLINMIFQKLPEFPGNQ